MNKIFAVTAIAAGLAVAPAAFAVQPNAIPAAGMLDKAPVGSTVNIASTDHFGHKYDNYFSVGEHGTLHFQSQQDRGE